MSRPRIAIATCADYADLKVDDELLREALEARGVEAAQVVWDDASVDWADFDACLIRSTWDYHEKHPNSSPGRAASRQRCRCGTRRRRSSGTRTRPTCGR